MKDYIKFKLLTHAILMEELNLKSIKLYCYMLMNSDDDGFVNLSTNDLMMFLGVNKSYLSQHLRYLKEKKMIKSIRKHSGDSRRLIYRVHVLRNNYAKN